MTSKEAAGMLGYEDFPPGWVFDEIHRNGKLAGWVCIRDSEIHCFRLEEAKGTWLTRATIEKHMQPLINRFGQVTTTVRKANAPGHKFVKRLGFHPVRDDGQNIHYIAERLKHARL